MTTSEFKRQLNNIRATLKNEEAKILDTLNHVMGCEMLCEKLIANVDALEDENEKVVKDAENQAG